MCSLEKEAWEGAGGASFEPLPNTRPRAWTAAPDTVFPDLQWWRSLSPTSTESTSNSEVLWRVGLEQNIVLMNQRHNPK